jgi:hypothetical protein
MAGPHPDRVGLKDHVQICSNCRPDDRVRIEPAQKVWSVPTSLRLCPHALLVGEQDLPKVAYTSGSPRGAGTRGAAAGSTARARGHARLSEVGDSTPLLR